MNSLPSTIKWIKEKDPALGVVAELLRETNVNPVILLQVVRAIHNLARGSGHGVIHIEMKQSMVTRVNPEESNLVNVKALVDEQE